MDGQLLAIVVDSGTVENKTSNISLNSVGASGISYFTTSPNFGTAISFVSSFSPPAAEMTYM